MQVPVPVGHPILHSHVWQHSWLPLDGVGCSRFFDSLFWHSNPKETEGSIQAKNVKKNVIKNEAQRNLGGFSTACLTNEDNNLVTFEEIKKLLFLFPHRKSLSLLQNFEIAFGKRLPYNEQDEIRTIKTINIISSNLCRD
jgi:hypothetical protein